MENTIQAASPEELAAKCRAAARADAAGLDALTSRIGVYDTQSILTFGSEAAEELARSSDTILKSIRADQTGDPGPMLSALGSLMEKFDPKELAEEEEKGFRLFRSPSRQPERLTEKYRAMEADLNRAYIALKQYEAGLRAYDEKLKAAYDANARFYEKLVRFIVAGEQGLEEIRAYLRQLEAEQAPGGAPSDLDTARHACTLLERRVHDLRVSETAALQSLPMVQIIRANNVKLIQKLDSAFLVTLPVFRQTLAQAAARKRMRLQAQAMEALDRRTREALEARNAGQPRLKASGPEAREQLEALEQARQTILKGIEETRALQKAAAAERRV